MSLDGIRAQGANCRAMVVVALVALSVVLPFLKFGIPSGHDFEFHLNSWIEVREHWRQGIFYPHWAAMAHYGYGEARFIFYPPLSWMLGAGLGAMLPWKLVPAAYIWTVLTLAGGAMFLLARDWVEPRRAALAASFYAANPYHLVIVYWRSAMAELMAAIYLPLLLLLLLRAHEQGGRRPFVPLSLLLAAGWLTNLPSAVMMNYLLAALTLALVVSRRSWRELPYLILAALVGASLAAFFLFPAYHEQPWVNISQVLAPGVRPLDNFLFTLTGDADHNRFNRLVSLVALWEIAIACLVLILMRRREHRALFWFITLWGGVSMALMFRPTLPLWNHLPELRFVQLPWRWLLALNVSLALALCLARTRWRFPATVTVASLCLLVLVAERVQTPWWDQAADIQEMLDNEQDGTGNEGTDEYVPAPSDPYEADQKAPLVYYEGRGPAQVLVRQWLEEKRLLVAKSDSPGRLVLRLFNYPLWKVEVNGRKVEAGTKPPAGQMTVPIPQGESSIEVRFAPGRDRALGMLISVMALVILAVWYWGVNQSRARPSLRSELSRS